LSSPAEEVSAPKPTIPTAAVAAFQTGEYK